MDVLKTFWKAIIIVLILCIGYFTTCSKKSNILEDPGNQVNGLDTLCTINSLVKLDENLYTITFYGDYSDIVEDVNEQFTSSDILTKDGSSREVDYFCSLFSAFGNPQQTLFGRSFDNPAGWRCLTLLGRYNPPNGYRSLALVRMRDFGYEAGTNFDNLTLEEKIPLIEAAFHPPDGINEHGVVAGLANAPVQSYTPDPEKESIWITLLVRKILDNAGNVDEAVSIAQQYNICCPNSKSLGVHVLVADPSGKSVVLEMYDGQLQVIPNSEPWHVLTNSRAYNLSIDIQRANCWRYEYIYGQLQLKDGEFTQNDSEFILSQVGNPYTQWSAVYDMSNKGMTLFLDYDFTKPFSFSLMDE